MQLLSKYRTQLMGFAIIWVMFFHSGLHIRFIDPIIITGYGGVDIFFFLSGLGLYFSSFKDESNIQFYIRRTQRILPTYMAVILIAMICLGTFSFFKYLLYVSTIGFWIGIGFFDWYVPSILMFYFLFPFFIKKFKIDPYKTLLAVFLGTFFIIFLRIYIDKGNYLMLFLTRIPIFCIGVLFGKFIYEKKHPKFFNNINLYFIALLSSIIWCYFYFFLTDYLWKWGLNWYPFIGIVPGLCLLISTILDKLNSKIINATLTFLGGLSLEIYLIHIKAFGKATEWADRFQIPRWEMIVIISLTSILLSYFLSKIINTIIPLLLEKKDSEKK